MGQVEEALRDLVQHHSRRVASDAVSNLQAQLREMQRELRDIHKAIDHLAGDLRQRPRAGRPETAASAEEAAETVRFSPASLKHLRQRFDLTQQETAQLLQVSPVTITAWETGKSRPRRGNLAQISELAAKQQADIDAALGRQPVPDVASAEVKRLRKSLALTQTALAELIGVSAAAVTAWETGKTTPSRDNRKALADLAQKPRAELEEQLSRSGVALPRQATLSAEEVRQIRQAAGFSQRDLARKLGVSVNSVSNWETGRTEPRRSSVKQMLELKKS